MYECMYVYMYLSHALKNTANQRPGLPLHILRYATGEDFPKILKNHKKNIGKHFRPVFEFFQKFPKIVKDFPKVS